MPYMEDIWAELLVELKAVFADANAFFRYPQLSRRNWGDIIKDAESGGPEVSFPWVIIAFGRETNTGDGPITSVAKLMPVSIIYVCKLDDAEDIDFHVEQKMRAMHDRLVAGNYTHWQFPLDGNTGDIDFQGTDDTGMTLTVRQEPVYSGTYSFSMLIGEIAPVND